MYLSRIVYTCAADVPQSPPLAQSYGPSQPGAGAKTGFDVPGAYTVLAEAERESFSTTGLDALTPVPVPCLAAQLWLGWLSPSIC